MKYSATLECGEDLRFEFPQSVPDVGELMPCRRHGYCLVTAANRTTRPAGPRRKPALSPERAERLTAYLREHPGATRRDITAEAGVPPGAVSLAEAQGVVRFEVGYRHTRRYYAT